MAFEVTPSVDVRRDRAGRVRSFAIRSSRTSFGPAEFAAGLAGETLTPRTLAEQYIREVAEIYGLGSSATENFAAVPGASPSTTPSELRASAAGDASTSKR
jgi:hypothetical protein